MAESGGAWDLFGKAQKRTYKVSELTRELKALLEGKYPLIQVEGEISNFRRNAASGHCYFTLKDEGASIKCALFRTQAARLRVNLDNGLQVLAKGRLSVYEASGEYNLVVETLEPIGAGALALRFEELKRRLAQEGLFDTALKRRLPFVPRRIGVVTSPTGAAIRDFLRVLHDRWPGIPVLVAPARVQGEGAAAEICDGIRRLSAIPDIDVIVATRGGGSIEDLWPFNEEAVARAIRRSPVPVVSAVGHEIDVTISDFAADVRAPTPTAAAELVVPIRAELFQRLTDQRGRLSRALDRSLEQRRSRVAQLRLALADPRRLLSDRRRALDDLLDRAERAMRAGQRDRETRLTALRTRLEQQHPRARVAAQEAALRLLRQRLEKAVTERLKSGRVRVEGLQRALRAADPRAGLVDRRRRLQLLDHRLRERVLRRLADARAGLGRDAARLDAYSPLKVLGRGYALAYGPDGRLIRTATDVRPGDRVDLRVGSGRLQARIESVHPVEPVNDDDDASPP